MWYAIPLNVPANEQTVWIRLLNGFADPFKATYNSSTQQFTDTTNNIIIPCYMVGRWRPV